MKKIFSKKRMKKINKALKDPVFKSISGSLLSLAAGAALKYLSSPEDERRRDEDRFYSENEVQI